MATTTDLDKILNRVRALLAQADHPNTTKTEADTFRAKAEALMLKYRIEEITATEDTGGVKPVWRDVIVCTTDSEFSVTYRAIWGAILRHFDCLGGIEYVDGNVVSHVVGFDSDLRFAETMFLAAKIAFGDRLEPKYDASLSEQVNAYRMRMAGMEGRRIAEAIYGRDDKHLRPKVRKMFKDEAIARGEDPTPLLGKGVNVRQWRTDYADGFYGELWHRLAIMRRSRGEAEAGLVLAGRKEAIAEAFYERYPYLRPNQGGNSAVVKREECAKCKAAKSGYCREHAWMRPRAARPVRTNYAAREAGASAARAVDLGARPQGGRLNDPRPPATKELS